MVLWGGGDHGRECSKSDKDMLEFHGEGKKSICFEWKLCDGEDMVDAIFLFNDGWDMIHAW